MPQATMAQEPEIEASEGRHEAAVEVAREVLEQLLAKCRFRAKVKIDDQDQRIEMTVVGPDASMLVGKKGQTLDAVQYLVNRMVGRRLGEHKPISVDADGYRERREASLIELAKRLSDKAQNEGKIVALNPMSARDRRIIHLTLRDEPGVSTRSEGQGEERRLLIVPESA